MDAPRMEDQDDIFVWRDGFWCFRAEYSKDMLRREDYVVLRANTDEWVLVQKRTPFDA
jgi:hypothetical protein